MNAFIVLVDNGDTEPEVWAFRESDDAYAFIAARGGGTVFETALMGSGEARQIIAQEREGIS